MSDTRNYYTVVFKGDIRSMGQNLFKVVSPFGEVVAIGVGDAFEVQDALTEEVRKIRKDEEP